MFYISDISEIFINIMKKEQILGVSVCLLLSCASAPLNAVPEEGEEYTNITGKMLEAFILLIQKLIYFSSSWKKRSFTEMIFFQNLSTKKSHVREEDLSFLRLYIKTWSISGKLQVK